MKLHLTDRSNKLNNSFSARKNSYPHFLKSWHYHPELELILVLKSTGTRFIGDSIEKFEEGDVFLIGENLPHMLFNDEEYFAEQSGLIAEAIAIHFNKDFLKNIPEMNHISKLFDRASQGIHFTNIKDKMLFKIKDIVNINNKVKKTISLIKILNNLANQKDYKLLSNNGFSNALITKGNQGMDKVYEYIFKNFNHNISLKNVAEVANMNKSAFSRLFKKVNNKPYSKYLNEIRIGYACKLLIENKYNITFICYESGFNNISNFNRQFKNITSMTPSEYIKNISNID